MHGKGDIASLPLSARLTFVHRVLTDELRMRRLARIADRQRKIDEVETAINYLMAIDEEFHRAKSIVIEHKEVMQTLTAAVERHSGNQAIRADKALVSILDNTKEAA